jgi:hypothetical protein
VSLGKEILYIFQSVTKRQKKEENIAVKFFSLSANIDSSTGQIMGVKGFGSSDVMMKLIF